MRFSRRAALALTSAATVAATAIAVPVATAGASSSPAATSYSSVTNAGTLVSHVRGTFAQGTVRGFFVPARSFVRGGHAYVQGDLAATLRRANGSIVGQVVRHDVAIPVKASGASTQLSAMAQQQSCTILHLVLGPLDLNLLGLMVHLDQVVLDITAQSGPGNLLGNLLCAVAHLLDGTSPTLQQILNLSSLLNRLIGLLT